MTNFYRTERFKVDHATFGGLIFLSDFETDYRSNNHQNGSSIAQRIVSDLKFDEQCRKNIKNRERIKKYAK